MPKLEALLSTSCSTVFIESLWFLYFTRTCIYALKSIFNIILYQYCNSSGEIDSSMAPILTPMSSRVSVLSLIYYV